MCMGCGCVEPNDDHGDARNITKADLDRSAQNIATCCRQMRDACGQMGAISAQEMGSAAGAPA